MTDLPLHPLIVHFPIALVVVLPFLALLIFVGVQKGFLSQKTWFLVIALHVVFAGSSFLALETGEDQEELVETVVPENALEDHEELAELFAKLSAVMLLFAFLGLIESSALEKPVKLIYILLMLGLLGLSIKVGHSGGELVYKYNAAQAYQNSDGAQPSLKKTSEKKSHDDNDDD